MEKRENKKKRFKVWNEGLEKTLKLSCTPKVENSEEDSAYMEIVG